MVLFFANESRNTLKNGLGVGPFGLRQGLVQRIFVQAVLDILMLFKQFVLL